MSNGDSTAKQGLSPLAWVAIGCGGLAVLAAVLVAAVVGFGIFKAKEVIDEFQDNPARTTAETIVRLNPDLDLVSTDEEAGTITFTNNKTGETMTANFEDIAEGKLSITTDEGEFTVDASGAGEGGGVTFTGPEGEARFGATADLSDVPGWVPLYPGASDTQGTFSSKTAEEVSGMVSATTSDRAQQVLDHYKEWFEDHGYQIQGTSTNTTPEGSFSTLLGEHAEDGRTVNVSAVEQGGEVQVMVHYNAKK